MYRFDAPESRIIQPHRDYLNLVFPSEHALKTLKTQSERVSPESLNGYWPENVINIT